MTKEKLQSNFEAYTTYLEGLGYDTIVIIAYDTRTEICNKLIKGRKDALATVCCDLSEDILKPRCNDKGR